MCYDDTAQPPFPPGPPGAARGEDLVLTASDGNRFAAYAAHPEQPAGVQVALFGDAGGLRPFYKELALRFAEIGIEAVALDYYGRTAAIATRDDSFDFMPHLQQLGKEELLADTAAALAYLRAMAGGERATFTIGFCMGGVLSFWHATSDASLRGAIGFYTPMGWTALGGGLLAWAEQVKRPVLGLFGGADRVIPVSEVRMLAEKLDQVTSPHEIVIYPGAPHGFFELQMPAYADDAWKRLLGFINIHRGETPEPTGEQ